MSDKSLSNQYRLDALINAAGPELANVAVADVTTAGVKALISKTVPGGTIAGGEKFDGELQGTFSTATAAPTSMTFTVFLGGTGGASLGALAIPAAGLWSGAGAASWYCDVKVTFTSPTAVSVRIQVGWRTAAGVANGVIWFITTTATGLDTTVDKALTIAFAFVSTGTVTLHTDSAHLVRRG